MESNLVKARSSIIWILAVLVAFGSVWWIERETGRTLIARQTADGTPASAGPAAIAFSAGLPAQPEPRALTQQEREWARIAWKYFENNTDPTTGLAGSVDGFAGASMWDTASYLAALIAVRELGLLDEKAFDERLAKALGSLARLPLVANALPNKSYDIRSLAMTDYRNQPAPAGIGWSAIDIGRLMVPLQVIVWHYPRHTEAARQVIARWDTRQLARDGQLFGMQAGEGGKLQPVQEGRLGYEQYAASTFRLMGLDVDEAADWRRQLRWVDVFGVQVPVDRRDPREFGAQNAVVSEPYVLAGLETGWTRVSRELAWRVYRAQEEREHRTGIPTAVSEDHLDQPPYFVYNAVYAGSKPWTAVTEKGEDAAALCSLSVKAAMGWHALFRTAYTERLVVIVSTLNDPAKGWYAGRYEQDLRPNRSINANTNAVVLESLAFIVRGPLQQYR